MSGPFGNPAMVSSGGGGGPHLTGALEFGTLGSNPVRWTTNGAGLGYVNFEPFKADFASRKGGNRLYDAYPDKVTLSFWLKPYNSANWSGSGINSLPPSQNYASTTISQLGAYRSSNLEILGAANTSYSWTSSIFRNRTWYLARDVLGSETNMDTISSGKAAGWDHIMILQDWAAYSSGTWQNCLRMWVNGTEITRNNTPSTYYYGISSYSAVPFQYLAFREGINGDFETYMQSFNTSSNVRPDFQTSYFSFGTNQQNGYHGLLANFQIFPWQVTPSELGYNNAGVWSSIPYASSFKQTAGYTESYMDSTGVISTVANQTGELWATSYDFADATNWHYDNSGNGMHLFNHFHTSSYISHTTSDLPPM